MNRQREAAALLFLVALLSAAAVKTLDSSSPLRVVAGAGLLIALPWVAAARLSPMRESDETGGRISGSGALIVAIVILLGLLLSATGAGLNTNGIVAGMLIVNAVLAALGASSAVTMDHPVLRGRRALSVVMTVGAVAIAITAFAIARHKALAQAGQESTYAAFLVDEGSRLGVGLDNPTDQPARFAVRNLTSGQRAKVAVGAGKTRILAGFLPQPPPLRPRERIDPIEIKPVRVRISVSAPGLPKEKIQQLSTYAP